MATKFSRLLLILACSISFASSHPASDYRMAQAEQNKDGETVRALLNQHVDVTTPLPDGSTAIAWAAHWDDLSTADLLVRAGANVNSANDEGVTPLWLACRNGSAAMVEKLLAAGANPNATGLPGGESVLHRCAETGNVDAVKALLARGAKINATENGGQTPLMWAIEERHPAVARFLIEHGADINIRSKGGFDALLFAARQGDIDSGRLLLERGANVNDKTRNGLSALLVAIDSGREQFGVFLVGKGADPNAVDNRGVSALHFTVQQGLSDLNGVAHDPQYAATDYLFRPNMIELAEALLNHGANPNIGILKRIPPLRIGDRPKVSLIGASPFLVAAATGDVQMLKLLLSKGADPGLTSKDGTTPLMAAAGLSKTEDRTKDEEDGALEALMLLVELGGDVNAVNKSGLTAMHGAAYTGSNKIVQFLADHGAKLDVQDKFGETPLSIAAGDPNELADDFSRRVHPSTEALIRKLLGDSTSFVAAAHRQSDPKSE